MPRCPCLTPHLLTWTKPAWFSKAATDFTNSSSYRKSQHFWKPTVFIQVPRGPLSSKAPSSEHPKFLFSYWKVQRPVLHNNNKKYIYKIIKCCIVPLCCENSPFNFQFKGIQYISSSLCSWGHVNTNHISFYLSKYRLLALMITKTWEVKTFIKSPTTN